MAPRAQELGSRGSGSHRGPAERLLGRLRRRHPILGQLVRFALASGLATAINAGVFLVARMGWDTIPANLLALVVSTAVGTEVNRRFTFEAGHTPTHRWRAQVQNGGAVVFYAFYSTAVLLLLGAIVPDPAPVLQSLSVTVASVLSGLVRFVLLRNWVFEPDESRTPDADHDDTGDPPADATPSGAAPSGGSTPRLAR